ncbi:MAG TPA: DUF1684 domain-containing protein [Ktedonobacterales bacterium]
MTTEFDPERYVLAVEEFRKGKDEDFKESHDSPIPARDRAGFTGLRYFPPDPALRVVATAEAVHGGRALRMQTSDGRERDYDRAALLRFHVDGVEYRLTAYRTPDGDEDEPYFIPFRDAQAGKETYGAGRYLEVRAPHAHSGEQRRVTLDFNLAYNPYCAYNPGYSCPIPPAENTLAIAIRAGEMTYAAH